MSNSTTIVLRWRTAYRAVDGAIRCRGPSASMERKRLSEAASAASAAPRAAHPQMGERLRTARQARNLTLRDLAQRLGVSPSMISQIETGRASPSVSTLYAIASELDISLDELLFSDRRTSAGGDGANAGQERYVQRGDRRERIRLASGVVWERLTPDAETDTEFLLVTYEVGGASSAETEFQRHGGHEWGFVLEGELEIRIGFETHVLAAGDSISFPSSVPHRLANHGSKPVRAIWFVAGRGAPADDSNELHAPGSTKPAAGTIPRFPRRG
jgi:transcriptional regulator with XRE-family HTH domain